MFFIWIFKIHEAESYFKWAVQWKISFNPDWGKQVQEIFFSRKTKKAPLSRKPHIKKQKHFVKFLDVWLTFDEHLKVITTTVNKTIGLLRKLQKILSRPVLMTICKAFVRPHLDYGDVIYDEAYNEIFNRKLNLFNIMPA